MSAATLAASLAVFDEAALVAIANRGLVRRAARDLEEGKVALAGWEGEIALIKADGESVRISAAGPAKARCSCPAPGICRHRIAAVLLLQKEEGAALPQGVLPALLAEVAAFPEEALRRFAGRAGWRAALEIAEAGAQVEADGANLLIRLAAEAVEIRYLPGLGIEGMAAKVDPRRRKPLLAAALVAARRQAGIEPEPLEQLQAAVRGDVDQLDPVFLTDVRTALAEACRSALNLAPVALEERLFTLSVSSRADALPRLSAMLRGVAGMIRDRRARSTRFDPDQCLTQIASADALAQALAIVEDPGRRAALQGTIRRDFAEIGALSLRQLGAEAWRTESGARGVTAWFYAPDRDGWFSASLSRGAGQDPLWEPARAYAQEAIWGGAPLEALAGAELHFDSVAASPDGRLSLAAGIRPEVQRADPALPESWPCLFTDWARLGERLQDRLVGTLSAPAPLIEPVILRPRRTATPWFDDLDQRLRWPIEDTRERWLAVDFAPRPDRPDRIDVLAALLNSGWIGDIILSASIGPTGPALRPMALHDGRTAISLDLDSLPMPAGGLRSAAGIRALLRRRRMQFTPVPKPATAALLAQISNVLTGIAEPGCRVPNETRTSELRQLSARASRAGLEKAAAALATVAAARTTELPAALLNACFKIDQLRQRLSPLPYLSPQSG